MELLKNLIIDGLNGFSIDYIPLFLFQILIAGLLGYSIQFIINRKLKEKVVQYGVLIALSIAVLASIVKYSLPFSVLAAAAILLFLKGKEIKGVNLIGLVLLVIAGIGCGVGSVIQTLLGFTIILIVILFTPLKE